MTPSAPSNPAKGAFRLMDLLNKVKNISSAIVEFQQKNAKDLEDVSVKRLRVVSKALDLMFENGSKEPHKIT